MCIETSLIKPSGNDERPSPHAPIVGLLGPAVHTSDLIDRLREAGATVVPVSVGQAGDEEVAAVVALLACDLVVAEIPAALGLDANTPRLWERLSYHGIPRVIVLSGLQEGLADYDDLAAIAQRVLGEDATPVRLPVFDDDDRPVASLDLSRAVLDTPQGTIPAESGHLSVAAGDLSALLSVVAATVADDTAAEQYVKMIEQMGGDDPDQAGEAIDLASSDVSVGGGSINLGMPGRRPDEPGVPQRLGEDVADAVREGLLSPIVADTPEGAWLQDLHAWSAQGPQPADRLVRRDAEGDPADGWAGVVLTVNGDSALIRPVFGEVEEGYALITSAGSDEAGRPVPHRAWPTSLETDDSGAQDRGDGRPRKWTTTVRMSVGDTVSGAHVWLLPAE